MFINWRGVLAGIAVGFITLLAVLSIIDLTTGVLNDWWLKADQDEVLTLTSASLLLGGVYATYRSVKQTCQEYKR